MAGRASRLDSYQQRVAVAIVAYFDHVLDVAAGRSLVPQFFPAATPEPGLAGLQRQSERLGIHVGQGQHLARLRILHDGRQQAVLVPGEAGD
jgi:hypothetical protein